MNRFSIRSSSIAGGLKLENFVIFEEPVYSPCNGKVLLAADEFDDQIPPESDIENIAGNHILIGSMGVEVLLAHFKKGSIQVVAGDAVETDTILGQVGHSGNTSEPHLHMHVEEGDAPNTILNGKAVPFTINSHFFVRADRIRPRK